MSSKRSEAWKRLKKIRKSWNGGPCLMRKDRKTIWNPYKGVYQARQPARKTSKEKLYTQMKLCAEENTQDILWIGDEMTEKCEDGVFRIWLQNWNGFEKVNKDSIMFDLANIIDNNIHYYSIPESTVNPYHVETMAKIKEAQQRIIPDGEMLITNTPGFPNESGYQPGGIISGYQDLLTTRYDQRGQDQLGRWHYHQFYGKTKKLRIYSLYRVNVSSDESAGDTTAWAQQRDILLSKDDNTDPRKKVIDDFLVELQAQVEQERTLIVLADMNEGIQSPEKTNERMRQIGLINVMEKWVGEQSMPRTWQRGGKAIDHIWATANVFPQIVRAGYAPFNTIKTSDHRGIYMDLEYANLLDKDSTDLARPKQQRLKSTIPTRVQKYVEDVLEKWKYHNISARYKSLRQEFKNQGKTNLLIEELNKMDKQITEILKHAEKKCSKVPMAQNYQWSPKLKKAMANIRKWHNRMK